MNPQALKHVALVTTIVVGQVGCDDVEWPEEKYVDSLRVLGVRAEPPTLTPLISGGSSTRLSIICADGRRSGRESPDCRIETAWFTRCDNPERNDPKKCFGQYANWTRSLASTIADTSADAYPVGFGFGSSFDFAVDETILSQQARIGGKAIRYGVSYVYFAACAGRLVTAQSGPDRLPVECRDPDTGRAVNQERFVVGVTAVYSYDTITNRNPVLSRPQFDGREIPATCDATSQCPSGLECSSGNQCIPVVERCSQKQPESCRWHCLRLGLTLDSFSLFTVDGVPIRKPQKSLWLDHYTNVGSFQEDVAGFPLDAPVDPAGVEMSDCIDWQAPSAATEHAHLWTIVRDNRGGLTAWDQRVIVR